VMSWGGQQLERGDAVRKVLRIDCLGYPSVKEGATDGKAKDEQKPATIEEFHSHEKAREDTKKERRPERFSLQACI